ncbi:hypothetical protein [Amycolatopsis magusensis]|uniref:hypothetical protein n=1 Tax=Amycolatopsis magusensis TaxID=882444 RepID=UPI0037AC2DA9
MTTSSGTPAHQQTCVGEGLALGCLALGVTEIPSESFRIRLAFQRAWRKWPLNHHFPQIRADLGRSDILTILRKSPRRRSPLAAWARGRTLNPYLTGTVPSLDDAAEILAVSSGVALAAWMQLARDFTSDLDGASAA